MDMSITRRQLGIAALSSVLLFAVLNRAGIFGGRFV
jgi:hypothetical protein